MRMVLRQLWSVGGFVVEQKVAVGHGHGSDLLHDRPWGSHQHEHHHDKHRLLDTSGETDQRL
jgi:hypothetical protein